MSILNKDGYILIAKSLGRALAYIMAEQGIVEVPMGFRVAVDRLIRDLEEDNPKFDPRRFRAVLEAARLSEYSDEATDATW